MNFIEDIIEEIALEGLDGITFNSLWVRLESREKFCIKLDEKSKEFLWKSVGGDSRLEFFTIPEAREDLLPYDRFAFKDPATGIWVHNVAEQNIYPLGIVEEEGIQGSCIYYKSRKNVTSQLRDKDGTLKMNLAEILQSWGQRFVMVASQKTRYDALVRDRDPRLELTNMMYCVLERVGRMRYSGETSHALSKVFFNNIQSQIYYLCKKLQECGYVTKQQFLTQVENHKNLNVRLIHLKHFYVPVKNKYAQLMERVSLYLEGKPDHSEVYNVFKTDMGFMRKSFKCLLSSYTKYLKTGVKNYTSIRPDALPKEYLCKTDNNREKQIRVITLIQPFRANAEDNEELGSSDSEEDDEVTPLEWEFGKTNLDQCLAGLESGGSKGLSQSQFSVVMGFTRLEARSVLRKLNRLGLCQTYKMDSGRQRKNIFVSARLFKDSEVFQEFQAEKSALEKNMTISFDPNESINLEESTIESSTSSEILKADGEVMGGLGKRKLTWLTNPFEKTASSRLLRRTNWILEAVQESRVIENEFHILKLIWQKEQAQGIIEKMDKRSLKRILNWLQKENRIQLLKSVIYKEGQAIDLTIVCLPEITATDPAVKLAIEQAKLRLIGIRKENMEIQKFGDGNEESYRSFITKPLIHSIPSVTESIQRFQEYRNKIKANTPMKYDVQSWRRYGLVPKFKRYQLVHEMLYYLLYNYQGRVPELGEITANQHSIDFTWTLETPENNEPLDESTIDEMLSSMKEPPVYYDDLSWKRYLAPVPHHIGITENSDGWCLISDILILLPLTVVCQIVNIPYKIDGLEKLLSDPMKRLYPITYLPYWITNQLLYARRYVYSFYECCSHLSKMGLLSFGPQIRKAKEKAFIYVHPKAVLHDTRQSLAGYMKTVLPPDLDEFPVKVYDFNSMADVELYWCDMLMIVLDTNLNCKGLVQKEDDITGDVELSLEDACKILGFKDVSSTPMIPGDHRGAGGFDSSLFCHLMRNWFRVSEIKKVTGEGDKTNIHPTLFQIAEKISQRKTGKRVSSPVKTVAAKVGPSKGNRGGKGIKRASKRKRISEKIKAPPKKKVRKTYYDDIDFKALGLMTRERVFWSSREDGILLLCKVASCLMGGIRRGLLVPWTVVRDILHEKSKETSYDKSSKACQRRVAFAFKNPVSKMNVALFLSQAKQDKDIMNKYGNKKFGQANLVTKYKELVSELLDKFKTHEDEDWVNFPESMDDLNSNYELTKLTNVDYWRVPNPDDIKTNRDIYFNVLYDLIHSFVITSKDKQGRSHEMYRIFNQYPDFLLTQVFSRMKDDGILTKIKKTVKPLMYGVNHHQLAQRYKRRFLTRFPDSMFSECHEFLERLWQKYVESDGDGGINIKSIDAGGLCASMLSLTCLRKLKLKVKIPREILVLDRAGCNLPVSRGRIQKNVTDSPSDDDDDYDDDDDDDDDEDDLLNLNKDGERKKNGKRKKIKKLLSKEKEENLMQHIIDIVDDPENDTDTAGQSSSNTDIVSEPINNEAGCSKDTDILLNTDRATTSTPTTINDHPKLCQIEVRFEAARHISVDNQDKTPTKSLSRALLALARNQSFQKISNMNFNFQDNILINTCDIEAFLMPTMRRHVESQDQPAPSSGNSEISSLFLSPEKFKDIIRQQQVLIPFNLDLIDLWKSLGEDLDELYIQDLKNICEFVSSYGIMGVKQFEFEEKMSSIEELAGKLFVLVDNYAVLQVGVNCRRYVSFQHARPWLIHSYRNMRGRGVPKQNLNIQESDSINLLPESTSSDIHEAMSSSSEIVPIETDEVHMDPGTSLPTNPDVSQIPLIDPDLPTGFSSAKRPLDEAEESRDPAEGMAKRRRSSRTKVEEETDASSDFEKVRLICRPWRKPEGHLNRSSFSSMLESVLLFVMANPSCIRKAIEDKFGPYLKPVALLELLEVLQDLGCVTKNILRKTSSKTSLFSKPTTYQNVEIEKEGDIVMYESTPDCCLKFGQFSFFLSALN